MFSYDNSESYLRNWKHGLGFEKKNPSDAKVRATQKNLNLN